MADWIQNICIKKKYSDGGALIIESENIGFNFITLSNGQFEPNGLPTS